MPNPSKIDARGIHFLWIMLLLAPTSLRGESASMDPIDPSVLEARVTAGCQWLLVAQQESGLFRYGWEPSLDQDFGEESLIRQAGAAAALCRASRVLKRPEWQKAGANAVRSLLTLTERIPSTNMRRPRVPYREAHPVGFSALLLLAIAEHPSPDEEMQIAATQLAAYLIHRQREDGSFRLGISDDPRDDEGDDEEGLAYYPGEAVFAIARSARGQNDPARLKRALASRDFYWRCWRRYKEPAFIPWQTAAHAEIVEQTGDRTSAAFVFEMNDWLLQLQYQPREAQDDWVGGFAAYADGQRLPFEPGISSASYAESLADAWRTARLIGDRRREERYRQSLADVVRFISRLQFEPRTVEHFMPDYRPKLIGGFRAGLGNGTVRIDFTQHALMAMTSILAEESPQEAVLRPNDEVKQR